VAQARRLVAAAIGSTSLPRCAALELVEYHLRRNEVARRSHYRKKCLQLIAAHLKRRTAQMAA
jgi:hypothetical protein